MNLTDVEDEIGVNCTNRFPDITVAVNVPTELFVVIWAYSVINALAVSWVV